MIRPGLTFALWLAIAVLVLVNDLIGDTFIADRLPAIAVEWYKVLVPLPYVVLMAIIHARRTAGPNWLEAALLGVAAVAAYDGAGRISLRTSHLRRRSPANSSTASPSGGARPIRCWSSCSSSRRSSPDG